MVFAARELEATEVGYAVVNVISGFTRDNSVLECPRKHTADNVNNEKLEWSCSKCSTSSSYNSTREPSETILVVLQPDMYENPRTKLGKPGL